MENPFAQFVKEGDVPAPASQATDAVDPSSNPFNQFVKEGDTPAPVAAPRPKASMQSMYDSKRLSPRTMLIMEELQKRGKIDMTQPYQSGASEIRAAQRAETFAEMAGDTGWLESLGISFGKGITDVGRGVGLMRDLDAATEEGMAALETEHPVATTIGEAAGQSAPFMIPGTGIARIASLPARALATGAVSAVEGGILADDWKTGAGVGGTLGFGLEMVMPVVGRMGRKLYQRITGKSLKGAVVDVAGNPTPEMVVALEKAGMTVDDLKDDALEFLQSQANGADMDQVARGAKFTQEGIPLTKGDITQDFQQQALENRLETSATSSAAETLREFRLTQSEAIKESLDNMFPNPVHREITGEKVKSVLEGRHKMLRTQKNDLYNEFADNAATEGLDAFPMLVNPVTDLLPDARKMRNLNRVSGGKIDEGMAILAEYGLVEPTDAMGKLDPQMLTIDTYDDLQQSLKLLMRGDQSGGAAVAFAPIIDAIEKEADNMVDVLSKNANIPADVLAPLKAARETVKTMKTEFAPQSTANKMISAKKNGGDAQMVEASRVYDTLFSGGTRVEDTRRLVKTLMKQEGGDDALGALQSNVVMDLINSGFTTESRKIKGKRVFNPIAFRKRFEKMNSEGKLTAIFANNKDALKKLETFDSIAGDLIPPDKTVPKGSAVGVLMDMFGTLGLGGIPFVRVATGGAKAVADPIKESRIVKKALMPTPDKMEGNLINSGYQLTDYMEKRFPSLASALGIATATAGTSTEEEVQQ